MIPKFPRFKKLEFFDKVDVETFTRQHPPYSDFDFMSMWCWDTKGEMEVSLLNGNLIVRFTDYLTSEPFVSFIGSHEVFDTTDKLLKFSIKEGVQPALKLLPEVSVINLDKEAFIVSEDRNHFDYIYSVEEISQYEGSGLKTHRNSLNSFLRKYRKVEAKLLDVSNKKNQQEILRLYGKWEKNNGFSIPNETIAINRFLKHANQFSSIAIGVYVEDELVAFNLHEKSPVDSAYINCLFAKTNSEFIGINAFLMNATAKILKEHNYKYINYEQDLGIYNLRQAKNSFQPHHFLKKYTASFRP
ncbi:MAG: DUF2156 domain-containing protein [Candidatus Taylorbacteria bacterium]|nr:DUF2156 domain-containing protein [Candidatus Taylorbacteria bacterium]